MKAVGSFYFILLLSAVDVVFSSSYSRTQSYRNDIVTTCYDKNDDRVKVMMNHEDVDVWKVYPSGTVEMRMNRALYASVQYFVRDVCYVSIDDVETHVRIAENLMLSASQKYSGQMAMSQELDKATWFDEYHDLASITAWYKKLEEENPHLVTVKESIGKTSEGRDISAVHITAFDRARVNSVKVPKFYIQCLIHAREWISGASCMYQAKSLVDGYKTDARINKLVKSMEFVIVPVVNPDGYVYTWTVDRMWRKNRAETSSIDKTCVGVDLNRNFPLGWIKSKNNNRCAVTYPGENPVSELETRAIMKYYKAMRPFVGAIDFHSYGQLILRPWGYKETVGQDEVLMSSIGKQLADEIKKVSGRAYTSEKSHDLYEAHGIASDWLYSESANNGHTALAYTIELRDNGRSGFLLPPYQIKSACEEANKAFLHLAEASHSRYLTMAY